MLGRCAPADEADGLAIGLPSRSTLGAEVKRSSSPGVATVLHIPGVMLRSSGARLRGDNLVGVRKRSISSFSAFCCACGDSGSGTLGAACGDGRGLWISPLEKVVGTPTSVDAVSSLGAERSSSTGLLGPGGGTGERPSRKAFAISPARHFAYFIFSMNWERSERVRRLACEYSNAPLGRCCRIRSVPPRSRTLR